MPQQQAYWLELEREAKPARALLERIPQDRLDWRSHAKSRTLGELARHMASIPGIVTVSPFPRGNRASLIAWESGDDEMRNTNLPNDL